jgi:hypothetical protein
MTGIGELPNRVALERRALHNVVVARGAVVHREAVVVLRGDDDVLHPGVLRGAHPCVGVEAGWVEHVGDLLIFREWDLQVSHHVLRLPVEQIAVLVGKVAAPLRVKTPVDEHAKAGVFPPREAAGDLLGGLDLDERLKGVGVAGIDRRRGRGIGGVQQRPAAGERQRN